MIQLRGDCGRGPGLAGLLAVKTSANGRPWTAKTGLRQTLNFKSPEVREQLKAVSLQGHSARPYVLQAIYALLATPRTGGPERTIRGEDTET
jgi:hypothetical protein